METKRVILTRFVDFDITPNKRVTMATASQIFKNNSLFDEKFLKNRFLQLFASILLFLPFS